MCEMLIVTVQTFLSLLNVLNILVLYTVLQILLGISKKNPNNTVSQLHPTVNVTNCQQIQSFYNSFIKVDAFFCEYMQY